MSGPASGHLSRGFLPISALHGRGPTAVGLIDLERSIHPRCPEGGRLVAGDRDALLLIRLHGNPLAVVHIGEELEAMDAQALAAEAWRQAGDEIRAHVERCGCVSPTVGAEGWMARLQGSTACACSQLPSTPGAAAVIISTIGQDLEQLERCLRSLVAQRLEQLEILVVDNRPQIGQAREVAESFAAADRRVRYVAEQRPGLSVARNRGLAETDAELVAFTDDDVVVDPLWLEWLLAPFADRAVAATCGMVLPLALETNAQKRFERYLGFSRGVRRKVHDLRSGRAQGLPFYPFLADVFGSGNSMAFRRAGLVGAGGFDPALGAGSPARAGEETDAFSRAILAGSRIVYEPRALSWHEHRRDAGSLRDQIFGYGVGVGALVTKALFGDARFYRAAVGQLIPVLANRGRLGPRAEGNEAPAGVDDLLRARRAGIVRGPMRYAQGMARARKLGFYRMKPEGRANAHDGVATR